MANHTESLTNITKERIYPWLFALGITTGELLVITNVKFGLTIHIFILAGLLVSSALIHNPLGARFYLSLVLAPLIRILSLSMPLAVFPLSYWYLVVSFPLLVGAFIVARLNGYHLKDIGLNWNSIPVQFLTSLIGLPLGMAEFFILQPKSLISCLELKEFLMPALILLICTGFTEEVIFRGIMQKASSDFLGHKTTTVLISFIFAVLHITHLSVIDVFFVFGVAVLFSFIVYRTGSILGVTLAHGITNITMYLVWPLIF